MKYNYTITGSKNNKAHTEEYALDGDSQTDSFKFLASFCAQDFDEDRIDNIEYKGKY